MKKIYVYDIETYLHCFLAVYYEIYSKETRIFELSKNKNDLEELKNFLYSNSDEYFVGYNNIEFDYPVIHDILLGHSNTTEEIFSKAQIVIDTEVKWQITIPEWKTVGKQIDLFKINHFDNDAKRTSLKALEIAMKMNNVEDLPYDIEQPLNESQIKELTDYCIHDVRATALFFFKNQNEIKLRLNLSKEYNLNLLNHNDPKIGEAIFMKFLCEELDKPRKYFVENNTKRPYVDLKDCILDYITFENKSFNVLLDWLKEQRVYQTKGFFTEIQHKKLHTLLPYMNKKQKNGNIAKLNIIYDEVQYDFGTGGLHACIDSGIYKEDDDLTIIDLDVASYYPNLAIVNDFYPEHLSKTFCKIYKNIYDKRKAIPKSDSRNYGLKIALNGCFGKAGESNSPFFDIKFLLSITLNGQLLLLKLVDMLYSQLDIKILQANTDGITFKVKRSDVNKVQQIRKEWEDLTNLELEDAVYKQMIIRDVNNYIAEYQDTKIKLKGIFEIEKAWHKNHSMLVIPIALKEYFINDIPIETTIKNHKDVYDFCLREKFNKGFQGEFHSIDGQDIKIETTQKNVRYLISNSGKYFYKRKLETDTLSVVNKNTRSIEMNRIPKEYNIEDYDINYHWYIKEAYKIKNTIEDGQLKLF